MVRPTQRPVPTIEIMSHNMVLPDPAALESKTNNGAGPGERRPDERREHGRQPGRPVIKVLEREIGHHVKQRLRGRPASSRVGFVGDLREPISGM